MATYRLYFLNAMDRIAGFLLMECEDDREALERARDLLGGRPAGELWREARLVGRIEPLPCR